jgi:hypothetical protein
MDNEEKKYKKLIDDLKNLPQINAPQNFESDILRKINSSEYSKKESFWQKILSPGKLIPAGVAIVSAIIIFSIVEIKSDRAEDPLNLQPRLREDLMHVQNFDKNSLVPEEKSAAKQKGKLEIQKNEPKVQRRDLDSDNEISLGKEGGRSKDEVIADNLATESLKTAKSGSVAGVITFEAEVAQSAEVKKENFNFMQINLSPKEKREVEKLKEQLKADEKAKSE